MRVYVRTVDRSVASGAPTSSLHHPRGVGNVSYHDISGCRQLAVALQAEIQVVFDQQFFIDGSVRAVTHGAPFAQRFMLEYMGPRLIAVALPAGIVGARDEHATGVIDVFAMRTVAVDTGNHAFRNGVMILKVELCIDIQMALKAGRRVFPWIDDLVFRPTGCNVQTSRPVACFAARDIGPVLQRDAEIGVLGITEILSPLFMAQGTGFIADILRARHCEGRPHHYRILCTCARSNEKQAQHEQHRFAGD